MRTDQEDIAGQTAVQLDEELRLTRQDLREISDQYDRLVEEFSTSNEEMLSINEELQSANEELETSKEELQSLNEELNTLNSELRSKVEAVGQTNNDLNNLLSSTEIATIFLDMDCRIRWFTPPIKEVMRLIPSDIGRPIQDLASSVTGTELESEARQVLKDLAPVETEVDNREGKYFIRRVLPYRTADNRIDGIVATFVDITDHKRGQQLRERLMHELSHRIKNTLATVQAMVHGLGRRCESLPDFLTAFEPRLAALARAHAILTLPGDERIELRHLLNRELRPYLGDDFQRVTSEGDKLYLARESALALEMVFHELVTNATKYGALSNETGIIHLRLTRFDPLHDPFVRLDWIESGGPAVESQGAAGFGSLLIESSVTHDLAGTVVMRFERSGLHCTIEFPVEEDVRDGKHNEFGPKNSQKRNQADGRRSLSGLRLLVVEDVGVVAIALKAMLETLGCVVVGMAGRLPQAKELSRQEELDGVLLDLNLGGQYAFPLIDQLREHGIPFIIMSGYDAALLRPDLGGTPQLQKPFTLATLEAIAACSILRPRGWRRKSLARRAAAVGIVGSDRVDPWRIENPIAESTSPASYGFERK